MGTRIKVSNLRKIMKARKLNVQELSERTGIPRASIYSYLRETTKTPTLKHLQLMARALDCSVPYLLDE